MVQIIITIQDTGHLDQDAELLLCLVGQYANANGLKIVGERRPGEPPRYWFERRGDNAYVCTNCGAEAIFDCNNQFVLSERCHKCGAYMALPEPPKEDDEE